MDTLKISAIQADLKWEDIEANKTNFDKLLTLCDDDVDVIILPEMFTTGFSMNSNSLAESMDGNSLNWMKSKSAEYDAAIVGSLIININGSYYNRLVWMMPDGEYLYYDKKHLFAMAGEDKYYNAGGRKLIVEYKGWKFCPQICYDLRFPEWGRNKEQYDVLIYVANWPKTRSDHWISLLKARAIENQAYVVGVNRVGEDGKGLKYSGNSRVYDYNGMSKYKDVQTEKVINVTLDRRELTDFRSKLPFLKDQDIDG